jgi:rod shape-determining protein MreC
MRFIYTKTFTKIFTIFVLLALLVILDARGYLGLIKDGFFRTLGTTTSKVTDVTLGVKNIFETLFTIKRLALDNAELNQKIEELSFENARLKSAQEENQSLRQALNFRQQSKLNLLPVEVLTSDPTGFTQVFMIDKGQNVGIRLNQSVVVAPGILVGKITKLYPHSAQATLITDPSIVINAEVVDSGARGLIRGEHGLGLALDLVTQNDLIKTGDSVITSGLSDDAVRGLLIGNVSAIRSNTSELFQKAFVSSAADLRSLRFLFVVQ